jgi:TPR repeat protein
MKMLKLLWLCCLLALEKENPNSFLGEARKLEAANANDAAEKEYRLAIAHARDQLTEQDLSDAIYSLGQFYRHIKRFGDAITELLDSLKIQERLSGDNDVRTGRRLAELAAAYIQNREVGDARAVLEKLKASAPQFRGQEKKFVEGLYDAMDKFAKATATFDEISAAAAKGDVHARFQLARCYEEGIGVAADSKKSFVLFSALAAEGHLESQFYVGVMYDKARGVPRDAAKAAEWYRKAAERGFAIAQYNYAVLLASGDGIEQDLSQALIWAKKAEQGGHAGAARVVAIIERDLAKETTERPSQKE